MNRNENFRFPSISTHLNNSVSHPAISSSLWSISSLVYPNYDVKYGKERSSKGQDSYTMDMLWEDLEALDSKIRAKETAEMVMRPSSCNGYFEDHHDHDHEVYYSGHFGAKLADYMGIGDKLYSKAYSSISTGHKVTHQPPKRASGMKLKQRALNKLSFLHNMARHKRK